MARARSLRLVVLTLGIAVTLGLFTLAASSPGVTHAAPAVSTAFVALDGTNAAPCPQDAPCRLIQYAVDLVADGGTVYVAGGVYHGKGAAVISVTKSITLYGGWDGAPTGDPVRDPDTYVTVLDGQRQRRGVYIGEFTAPRLEGFTIAHGDATGLIEGCGLEGGSPGGCGGGILAYLASPTIADNVISDCVAAASTATGLYGYGGGIYMAHSAGPGTVAVITGNTVISNAASTAGGGYGGGLYLKYSGVLTAQVEGNQIIGNWATTAAVLQGWGGGISGGAPQVQIRRNLIEGNRTNASGSGQGAGLYQWYGGGELSANLVQGNEGAQAVYLGYSPVSFEANQVVGNSTSEGVRLDGGGGSSTMLVNNIVARSGDVTLAAVGFPSDPLAVTLLHNTLAGSGTGYGVYVDGVVAATMSHNIVASHSYGITNTNPASATISADYTLFWDNDDGVLWGTHPVVGDPAFVDPEAGNYHLGAGSAAIDAGVFVGIPTDIDGDWRPIGAGYDIGADESWLRVFLPLALRN